VTLAETDTRQLVDALLGPGEYRFVSLNGGTFSEVFGVHEMRSETDYVLRVAPPDDLLQLFYERRMMLQEPALHDLLAAQTKVPVPRILTYDFSRELLPRDYLIMERLPGAPLSQARLSPKNTRRALSEWGHRVAEIHRVTQPDGRFGYLGDHRCMEPQATWAEAFTVMWRKLLDDIVACGVYDQATADRARRLLEGRLTAFEDCRTPHLCHGDLQGHNALVTADGRVTGLLNFDRACWGDPEWDLAIADYSGAIREPFWEGYGRRVESHPAKAAIRRFFYRLYEHQKYIVISLSARRNDPRGARQYAQESLAAMVKFQRSGVGGGF